MVYLSSDRFLSLHFFMQNYWQTTFNGPFLLSKHASNEQLPNEAIFGRIGQPLGNDAIKVLFWISTEVRS